MSTTAVIILNWNGKELLRRYLPTVICNTTAQGAEVIVADNASTDGSVRMLNAEFPHVRVLEFDRNYGFAGGYNRALRMVEHDYVVLLNSDVAPGRQWLEPLLALMEADDGIAAVGPKIRDDKAHDMFEYAGAAGGYIDLFCYPFCRGRVMDVVEKDNGQYDADADVLWVSGAAMLVRRTLYNSVGGLDESFFAHMEEIDLCWRLRNMGYRLVAVGGSAVFHLGGATLSASNPKKTYLNFRNNLSMLVKNYNSRLWPLVFFLRLLLDGVAGLRFVVSGQWRFCWAIVRAHWSVFWAFRGLISKRRELKQGRQRSLPPEVRRYSVVWRYYVRRMRSFASLEGSAS